MAPVNPLGDWEMELKGHYNRQITPDLLRQGSALVMTGENRSAWRHDTPSRRTDTRDRRRGRRLSLTFRIVLNYNGING